MPILTKLKDFLDSKYADFARLVQPKAASFGARS